MDETLTASLEGEKGGWRTFPFVTGGVVGVGMAASGVLSNLLVYLIQQFNIRSIEATQIVNVVNGCTSLSPIIGAIIADSCFGCLPVASIASSACLLGMLLFTLTAALPSLSPPPCTQTTCQDSKPGQLLVLYMASALMAAGTGGTRYNLATLGANQFHSPRDQGTFFNWYFVSLYVAAITGQVGIVYIQDNSGWTWGFGCCAIIVAIGLFLFLQGRRYYRHTDLKENPFVGLVNVVVLAVERRKNGESSEDQCYYSKLEDGDTKLAPRSLTPGFRFLNRAALLEPKAGTATNGSTSSPGRPPCTVDQVEDLKSLLRLLPLVATAIPLNTIIITHSTLTTLQALTTDRHVLPPAGAAAGDLLLPAGSVTVFVLTAAALSLPLLDRAVFPAWRALTRRPPSPLHRMAVGHAINAVAIAGSALVESSRLRALRSDPEPLWVMWLVPPLVLVGLGEAFHFPGQMALYYQEFPGTLRSTATGLCALTSGIAFYLSSALIALVRRMTDWLQDDVNQSRLDNVYWMLAGVGVINFGYLQVCASLYKQRS